MQHDRIQYLFTDVGDTLLRNGQLLPEVMTAMYQLAQQGIEVVPVTGASGAAAETMIRQWPVKMMLAENGAIALLKKQSAVHWNYWQHPDILNQQQQEVLNLVAQFGDTLSLASDQRFRLADVAINLAQDNHQPNDDAITELLTAVHDRGWFHGISSIHLNIWQSHYNKSLAIVRWMEELLGVDQDQLAMHSACIGDSPNDADMFARIPRSYGVNGWQVRKEDFSDEPAMTLANGSGWGFVELAHKLLAIDYWDEA